jgi:hypothetical protein
MITAKQQAEYLVSIFMFSNEPVRCAMVFAEEMWNETEATFWLEVINELKQ